MFAYVNTGNPHFSPLITSCIILMQTKEQKQGKPREQGEVKPPGTRLGETPGNKVRGNPRVQGEVKPPGTDHLSGTDF